MSSIWKSRSRACTQPERAEGIELGRREDVRHGAVVVAHLDVGAERLECHALLDRELGRTRDGPDAMHRIEQLPERRHAADGLESHMERAGEGEGGDRAGDDPRQPGTHGHQPRSPMSPPSTPEAVPWRCIAGAWAITRSARREKGRVCMITRPGPVSCT